VPFRASLLWDFVVGREDRTSTVLLPPSPSSWCVCSSATAAHWHSLTFSRDLLTSNWIGHMAVNPDSTRSGKIGREFNSCHYHLVVSQ